MSSDHFPCEACKCHKASEWQFDKKMLTEQIDALTAERDRLALQIAGCLTVAEGNTKEPAIRGEYGWSLAYEKTLQLSKKLARYREALLYLVNETKGFLSQANVDDHGVTNIRCLELVIRKAEEALKDPSEDGDETKD